MISHSFSFFVLTSFLFILFACGWDIHKRYGCPGDVERRVRGEQDQSEMRARREEERRRGEEEESSKRGEDINC